MRTLVKLFVLLILISPLVIAAVAWLALSEAPLVTRQVELSHQDIARAQTILRHNDPRYLPPGAHRAIEIGPQDLDLAANYLLQKLASGSAQLALATDRLQVQATVQIPRLPWRRFVNFDTTITALAGQPEVASFQLGSLRIPGSIATLLGRELLAYSYNRAQLDSATAALQSLQLFPDRLRLTYRWDPVLLDHARDTLLSDSDRNALRVYHDLLVDLQSRGIGTSGSLVTLLQPLFAGARERSRQHDPVEENIALLTVLGIWASRQDIGRLVPGSMRRPSSFRLKLQGRTDFAQHLLTSAALAARGDSVLSDAVGLFKEISDTDHGSGFSFTDIAADRAGTRFGELASRSPRDARRLQQRLAAGVQETDIMPPAGDLPEHMRAEAFRQRFGQVGSAAYQRVMEDIEQRIDACSLYRG